MEDVAVTLLENIRREFERLLGDDAIASTDYADVIAYADRVGNALAGAFGSNLSSEVLPDGEMYWNIAERVVRPMLEEDHRLVADAAQAAQQALNEVIGINLQAQRAALNENRVKGILNKITAADQYDEVARVLQEPVKNFSRSVVDETLRSNVNFQGKAGLSPRIIRRSEHDCCPWCSEISGTYTYPDVPDDVYRRHDRCRCTVIYDPRAGETNTLWTQGDDAQKRALEREAEARKRLYDSLTAEEKKKRDAAAAARAQFAARQKAKA